MKTIVLAAGYAVRLNPLTLNTPKPLLKVGGKTMIDRILAKLDALNDSGDIYVVTNARFFNNFEDWALSSRYKSRLRIINDGTSTNETRLGAINDLELVIRQEKIDDDLLVLAGDNLFELDMAEFMVFARSKTDGITIAVHDIGDIKAASSFGVVTLDKHGRIAHFEEKPPKPTSTLVSTGIYYFPKKKLPIIETYVKMANKLDAPGYYIGWLSDNDNVYGFRFLEDWCDIGNIESYKKADDKYSKKEK